MIISRTPYRISFFGGGTDYPAWYLENGGRCISATINKYCYLTCRELPPFFDHRYYIRYFKQEKASSIEEIEHPVVRHCINYLGMRQPLEVVHTGDLPAQSGMGSSSSFTVGLLNCFNALSGKLTNKRELAEAAIHVEQNLCQESVGSQDQVAASFGGLNSINFSSSGDFNVQPIPFSQDDLNELSSNLLLCYTGVSRTASEIAEGQISRIGVNRSKLRRMMEICDEGLLILNRNFELGYFADLLNEQWVLKKSLSDSISGGYLDELYEVAIENGALAGKLLGAGYGGFMLFVAPQSQHSRIKAALPKQLFVPFRFESNGSSIIYFNRDH